MKSAVSKLKQALDAVEQARAALAKAENDLRELRKRRKILCSCGKMHEIGKLALLVTHWHDDDYWIEGEWRFVCPTTSVRNRLLFNDYNVEYNRRQEVSVAAEPTFKNIYHGLFAKREDVYEKKGGDLYYNCYVDEHRERFELPVRSKSC